VKFQLFAGDLSLDFINTLDNRVVPDRRKELIGSYRDLVDWAAQAGAISPTQRSTLQREAEAHPKDAAEVRAQAVELRECLYRLITAILRNRKAAADDLSAFNAYVSEALSHLELQAAPRAFRIGWPQTRHDLRSILWIIARSASDLFTGDDLKDVRECGADTCRWLFVDRSKNHSRRWCDMKTCGNRVKARKFYRRKSAANVS
jgi:predicted RNA-binding Zn ribbon-like protein